MPYLGSVVLLTAMLPAYIVSISVQCVCTHSGPYTDICVYVVCVYAGERERERGGGEGKKERGRERESIKSF